jgi:hypothetical protein
MCWICSTVGNWIDDLKRGPSRNRSTDAPAVIQNPIGQPVRNALSALRRAHVEAGGVRLSLGLQQTTD